jgi:hypothetical protein
LIVFETLIEKLEDLICLWAEHQTENYVEDYNAVLKTLLLLGWQGTLQLDTELPEDLILPEYLDKVRGLDEWHICASIPRFLRR